MPPKYKDYSISASIGRAKKESFDNISVNASVAEATSAFGRYIHYKLHIPNESENAATSAVPSSSTSNNEQNENPKRCAFDILLSGARKLSLPERFPEDTKIANYKRVMYNRVLQILEKAGLGFTPGNLDSGTTFVHSLTNSLWYTDPHVDKMEERNCHVPMIFQPFRGFNLPDRHKHKHEQAKREPLMYHAQQLDIVLEQNWINGLMWQNVKKKV